MQLQLTLTRPDGTVLAAEGQNSVSMTTSYQPGDQLICYAPIACHLWVKLTSKLPSCLLYLPKGTFTFTIPLGEAMDGFAPNAFAGSQTPTFQIAAKEDLTAHRNLALNPFDAHFPVEVNDPDAPEGINPISSIAVEQDIVPCYPHAYANRITRNDGEFYARNAIDGISTPGGHGLFPYHSWGGGNHDDLSFTLYFGRPVFLNTVILSLRSDFSVHDGKEHDTYWQYMQLAFSDGSTLSIHPEKTGAPQSFSFSPRQTSFLRLERLERSRAVENEGFAALNEIEAWGTDL